MQAKCLFCGAIVELIPVHGHYQCPACNTNALPCFDGDNCTNYFLNEQSLKTEKSSEQKWLTNDDIKD